LILDPPQVDTESNRSACQSTRARKKVHHVRMSILNRLRWPTSLS